MGGLSIQDGDSDYVTHSIILSEILLRFIDSSYFKLLFC